MSDSSVVDAGTNAPAVVDSTLGWDGERAAAAGLTRMSGRPSLRAYLVDLWQRREFLLLLPLGELRQQHRNTVIGSGWHLLSPLLMSGVYYLVFGVLIGARGEIENYAVYLISGVLFYRFTQSSIQNGSKAIVKNEKLLRSVRFPAAALPLSSTITETFAQGPALLVLIFFAVVTGEKPHVAWLLLVAVILIQAVFNLGLAMVAARLTVHFRDTEEILSYVLRLGFYLSGVLIGIDRIPSGAGYDWARVLFTVNPAYSYIRLARGLIFDGAIIGEALVICLVWSVVMLVGGLMFFWRFEGRYANAV